MIAKEFLKQAYKLDQQITSKLEQLDVLRSMTQKITVPYGGEVVSNTRNVTSLQDAIIRIMEAEEAIKREIDILVDLKREISTLISHVKNTNYRLILEKRYLSFRSWDQIAADLHYSLRWLHIMHCRALNVIDKLLTERRNAQ